MKLAEKVRHNVANTFVAFEGQELRVAISLGVTCFKEDDTETTVFRRPTQRCIKLKIKGATGLRWFYKV